MDLATLVRGIDAAAARSFVTAARHMIDALLIEAGRVRQTHTPPIREYGQSGLSREAPAGGWLSQDELRLAAQKISEAIAAEKWVDGALIAIRTLSALGAL